MNLYSEDKRFSKTNAAIQVELGKKQAKRRLRKTFLFLKLFCDFLIPKFSNEKLTPSLG